jgi:hypothetical protein
MVAITGRLAGVSTDVAYNIGIAMIATMALIGAAGLIYNLRTDARDGVAPRPTDDALQAVKKPSGARRSSAWWAG